MVLQDHCRRDMAHSRGRIPQSRPVPEAVSRRENWDGGQSPHSDASAGRWLSPRMIHRGTPACNEGGHQEMMTVTLILWGSVHAV